MSIAACGLDTVSMRDVLMKGDHAAVFPGESDMARRCRAFDWSATSLGSMAAWSPAVRVVLRTAMECSFPVSVWCGEDKILIYNDAFTALLGSKHPPALGHPASGVWEEIWPDVESMFETIARGERVHAEDAHFVIKRSDGPADDAWFTFSLSPVRDEDGSVVAYLNLATETTQRVRTEGEMRAAKADAERAERRLREVFAQAPGFLAVLGGPGHVYESVNDSYLQLIGHREVLGQRVADALPELAEQGFLELLDRVYASCEPFVGREMPVKLERVPREPHEERIVDFVYQPIRDASGACSGVVVHGSDVTETVSARREVERLLRASEATRAAVEESEERYRFLSNTIPVQVWTALPNGQLDFVSERTARYFGVVGDEVLGDAWLATLHPEDVPLTISRWLHSVSTGEPYETEFRLRAAGGTHYRWHLARATAQRGEDGSILRWFGTNTDIEDRRRAEAELERLTREATEANRAKSDFLAAMSHELRTPLNAIGGYAQLIELGLRGPVTEEQRIDLLKIQRSKSHLEGLVSDVLNFAKAGAGRIDYRAERVGVGRTLDAVREMVAPQAGEKSLRLDFPDVDRELCVVADDDRTRQILLNLLANALKFTGAGGVITVETTSSTDEVCIAVRDTGIGIPAAKLEQIFEPFVQAERALRPSDQGVGLGLAISRQLARAMGGDLRVESSQGSGSTFALTLPRCPS